jgi:hypothetical protein
MDSLGYIYDAEGTRVAKGTITSLSCDPAINGFQDSRDFILGPECSIPRKGQSPIRIDGALLGTFNLPRGCWEAKDEKDSFAVG